MGPYPTSRAIIRAALAKIRNASPMYSAGWTSGHAGLLWAIYEQAVLDHFLVGRSWCSITDMQSAGLTATTGQITTPSGAKTNVLELIGIDWQWAAAQIRTAIAFEVEIAHEQAAAEDFGRSQTEAIAV